jgi:hypothetical protein
MLSAAEEPFLQRLQSGSTVMMIGNFQHEKRLALPASNYAEGTCLKPTAAVLGRALHTVVHGLLFCLLPSMRLLETE